MRIEALSSRDGRVRSGANIGAPSIEQFAFRHSRYRKQFLLIDGLEQRAESRPADFMIEKPHKRT